MKGEVIPVSEGNMRLQIKLNNGKILSGEKQLDHNEDIRSNGIKNVFLKSRIKACSQAIERIKKADFVVIGPGDLYGSILPNLLVDGMSEAIKKSRGKVVFNCNLTNKKGQTENFSLEDYVRIIEGYIGEGKIDFVTFNKKKLPEHLVKKYEQREGKGSVVKIKDRAGKKKYLIFSADLLQGREIRTNKSDAIAATRSFIRHDGDKLAKVLSMIFELGDYENIIKEVI